MAVATHAGQFEVNDLDLSSDRVVEDVVRLEVAMTDSFAFQIVQTIEKLRDNERSAFFAQRTVLAHVLAESREIAEFHHYAASEFALVHEEELALDDGFVVELHENLIVGSDVLKELKLMFFANLDCVGFSCFFFSALEDFRLDSFAKFFFNLE